jgi:hypothetical protein
MNWKPLADALRKVRVLAQKPQPDAPGVLVTGGR